MGKYIKFYTPIVFFLLMLIDAQFSSVFENWTKDNYYPVAAMLIMAFMIAAVKLPRRYLVICGLIFGGLFDCYYIGIFGINLVVLPIIAYWVSTYKDVINTNLLTEFFSTIIVITVYQVFTSLIQVIFQLSQITPILFVSQLLGPTLLMNMLLFWVVIVPLRKIFLVGKKTTK
jgi:rod shape-determining protein MreD